MTAPGSAAPPAATGAGPATAAATAAFSASASVAPQDRAIKGRSTVASGGEATPKRSEGVALTPNY